jgi:hypothetical protein
MLNEFEISTLSCVQWRKNCIEFLSELLANKLQETGKNDSPQNHLILIFRTTKELELTKENVKENPPGYE